MQNTLSAINKKIAIVTTSHLTSNPRVVKEADALAENGYLVTVLYCYTAKWAEDNGVKENTWESILVGGHPVERKWIWNRTRIRRKLCSYFPVFPGLTERSVCRAYNELLYIARKLNADLYIGHNIGALSVVANAARYLNKPFAFDAEDFHRGESILHERNKLAQIIEDRYLPHASYISTASPLITREIERLFPFKKVATINNVFSRKLQPALRSSVATNPLKLFWFSQTVGRDRGIQDAIEAMNLLPDFNIELTILGNCKEEIKSFFLGQQKVDKHRLNFIDPVKPDAIFRLAAEHDIGLALEPAFSKNNDIALSNKIFSYLLAGNAVLASETAMQKKFTDSYPGIGRSHPIGDVEALASNLKFFYLNRQALNKARESAWKLAHDELNWEEEQKKLLEIIGNIFR